jgi:hypothetical protein
MVHGIAQRALFGDVCFVAMVAGIVVQRVGILYQNLVLMRIYYALARNKAEQKQPGCGNFIARSFQNTCGIVVQM